jgi:hypothetical protein
MSRTLTLEDIADLRAYEREREEFRQRIIELKRRRRVSVGDIVTFVFENRDTIRFQVQEMARAERILTDQGIQTELDIYNRLIPEPGTLSATMFLELTTKGDLEHWLPRLVGVERSVRLELADGASIPAVVDQQHAEQLTRDDVTASVHYVRFQLDPGQIDQVAAGPTRLVVDHPSYCQWLELSAPTVAELLADLKT